MKKTDRVLNFLYVRTCPGCGLRRYSDEELLCPACRSEWEKAKLRFCRYCGEEMIDCVCTRPLLTESGLYRLVKLFAYNPERVNKAENKVLYKIKRRNNQPAANFAAEELAELVRRHFPNYREFVVTYAPRSRRAENYYGYDHAKLVAKLLAEKLDRPFENIFYRTWDASEQKYLRGADRLIHAEKTTKLRRSAFLQGKRYLIVDDVVTTGSTLAAGAKLALRNGAVETVGAAIASRQ